MPAVIQVVDGRTVIQAGENTVEAARLSSLAQTAANTALAAGNFIDGGQAAAEAATSEGDFFSYSDGAGGIVYAIRTSGGSTVIAEAATKALVDTKADAADLVALDKPLTVSEGPNRVIAADNVNDATAGLSAVTISGGGSVYDENYVGFHKNRATLTTTGTAQVWPHLPTDNDLSNLRVFKIGTNNFRSTLSSPADYTAAISGSQVNITLATGLTSGERLLVEDKAAKVAGGTPAADYGTILGGYDNLVHKGVMQTVVGAHHRIEDGDHGTILGGSYSLISGGSYGLIVGGNGNEITSGGGVGSLVVAGYRNKASGATSSVVGGQSNEARGAQSFVAGGANNLAAGTASFVGGRNNSVSGSDSIAFGDGNTTVANYSFVIGKSNTITHQHSHAKGRGAVSSWQGQDIRYAQRDGTTTDPQRQHFFLDLRKYTTSTATALIETLGGVSSLAVPAGAAWKCHLQVTARGNSQRMASFDIHFLVQHNSSGVVSIVGTPVKTAFVDAGLGTGGNEADVSVAISGTNLQITVHPRADSGFGINWGGVLEVLEVR